MPDRFYHPTLSPNASVELTKSEAHHLLHVLRAKKGQQVELFDGLGSFATATVTALARKTVTLQLQTIEQAAPPRCRITLATAIPKGDRSRWLVEKAMELGISVFQPLKTERSVVSPGEGKKEKLEQTVIAAAKQSHSNWLMMIEETLDWTSFLESRSEAERVYVAHPGGKSVKEIGFDSECETPSVSLCIGPEGGFTDEEKQAALDQGSQLVSLGSSILRTETAALAMASWTRFQCCFPE